MFYYDEHGLQTAFFLCVLQLALVNSKAHDTAHFKRATSMIKPQTKYLKALPEAKPCKVVNLEC